MKKYLILTLLFSFNVFAATGIPSGGGTAVINNTVTVAGRVINLNDPNIKITISTHNNALSYNTVEIASTTSPYTFEDAQVPVGKKWTLLAFRLSNSEVGGSNAINVGHGTGVEEDTNDPVGGDVWCGGWNGTATAAPFAVGADSTAEHTCSMVVPASNYPFTRHIGTGSGLSATLYFLEEDA